MTAFASCNFILNSMAKSKSSGKKSTHSGSVDSLDDIEILNLYRYPEFYSDTLVKAFRNSKNAQKRLEDLLKGNQNPKVRNGKSPAVNETIQPGEPAGTGSEGEQKNLSSPGKKDIVKFIKKLIT